MRAASKHLQTPYTIQIMKQIVIAFAFLMFSKVSLSQGIQPVSCGDNKLLCQNVSLTSLSSCSNIQYKIDWKNRWNQHPNRKIILGSIFILLGTEGMIESFIPTENDASPSNQRIQQIGMLNASAFVLASGTVLLIRGIQIKRQNKLSLSASKNGIGLIYKL